MTCYALFAGPYLSIVQMAHMHSGSDASLRRDFCMSSRRGRIASLKPSGTAGYLPNIGYDRLTTNFPLAVKPKLQRPTRSGQHHDCSGLGVIGSDLARIDGTVLKISAMNIKNCLAPINQFAPEILTIIATFLTKQCDPINATAACQ